MRFGFSEVCLDHDTGPRHPENPDRLRAIRRELTGRHGVEYVEGDPAEPAQLTRGHDPEYIDAFREFCEAGGGDWDPDTVAVEATWDAALTSAGQAIWAARAAMDGSDGRDTPFALGRPPGHHAVADDAMGFCFLNNVVLAAYDAIAKTRADRVAIVDWDVHHGNGTQDITYDDPAVFYASIHERGLYPGTGEIDETGAGEAVGTNLNVPLPAGSGTADYLAVVEDLIVPAIAAFDPDLLLVSAGFDAHRHDPISRMRVTTDGYGVMTATLRDVATAADAPIAFVLEGGYGLDTLSEGVAMVHEVFDGLDPVEPEGEVQPRVEEILEEIREARANSD